MSEDFISRVEILAGPDGFEEVDRLAVTVPKASPFQTGELARAYAKAPDTTPIIVAVRDSRGAIIASLVAIMFSHGKRSTSFAGRWTLHCTVRGTPLTSLDFNSNDAPESLIAALHQTLPRGTLYVRHYPDRDSSFSHLLPAHGYDREDWLNFIVDLRADEAEIFSRMSKPRRKGIRHAEGSGLAVSNAASEVELDALYRLIADRHIELGIPLQSRELFEVTLSELGARGHAQLLLARHDGAPVASRVVLMVGEVGYDWYAGSNSIGRAVHADELLVWTAIRNAKQNGLTAFDFGGAGVPNEAYGPREFKRRFGGAQTNYGRFTKVVRPLKLAAAKAAAGALRRLL